MIALSRLLHQPPALLLANYRSLLRLQRFSGLCHKSHHRSGALHTRTMSERSKYSYQYPRPSLTVDAVIVTGDKEPQLLLIKRKNDPFAGSWALPGGFVDENEALEAAAARELQEETGVDPSGVLLTQVGAFGDPGRDPRGWCISVAFAALVPSNELQIQAADDAADAQLYPITGQLPPLAFDHKLIVRRAFRHLACADAVKGQAVLVGQLLASADRLEGPWQQQ